MSYKPYSPGQQNFFGYDPASCLDDKDPAFMLARIVPLMDLRGLKNHKGGAGQPPYHPALLLALWVYGMFRGIISSRAIAAACRRDMGFMYICGRDARPCFKTFCNFRNLNAGALPGFIAQSIVACQKLGLKVSGWMILDSSRIRANANKDKMIRACDYDEALRAARAAVGESRKKDDEEDSLHGKDSNGYDLPKSVRNNLANREAVARAIEQAKAEGRKALSPTDPECRQMKESNTGKIVPGYSMQTAIDKESGLIVVCDAVNDPNDHAFAAQAIRQYEQNSGVKVEKIDADSGYFSAETIEEIEEMGVDPCIPDQQTAREMRGKKNEEPKKEGAPEPRITIDEFKPVEDRDAWLCPQGRTLESAGGCTREGQDYRAYRAQESRLDCPLSSRCLAKSDKGRKRVEVSENHGTILVNRERFKDKAHRQRYRERKKIEHIFGHGRRNVGLTQWLSIGQARAKATAALFAIAHNMRILFGHLRRISQRSALTTELAVLNA
jgi:transposase